VRIAETKLVLASEAKVLFSGLQTFPALVLAVSGGPDSTALMVLAARWRDALGTKPRLVAVTIDHGLRAESKREAAAVARLARKLKIAHRTLRWNGRKPATGLQAAARAARYRLLGEAARKAGAAHIVTAHTLDDQAETVLIRMTRGSGLTGLGAMARVSPLPSGEKSAIRLVRPLLGVPKSRLIATLRAAKIPFAEDPSNRDPRFTRARMRPLMGALAQEGLDAQRLAQLAGRLKRAEAAIEAAVDRAETELAVELRSGAVTFEARRFSELPAEIALRLLGRAVATVGHEGPVELGKLETLKYALDAAQNSGDGRFRRTLAGAIVTLHDRDLTVEPAPARGRNLLTKRRRRPAKSPQNALEY
jgi:tRNA(Ile)-lysidine synthase